MMSVKFRCGLLLNGFATLVLPEIAAAQAAGRASSADAPQPPRPSTRAGNAR